MNEKDVDARLKLLFAEDPPASDQAFSDRVVRLAAYEQTVRRGRRRAASRLASEAIALIAILATFASLARSGPVVAGLGDPIPLGSPAMLGLAMLVLWLVVVGRSTAAGR